MRWRPRGLRLLPQVTALHDPPSSPPNPEATTAELRFQRCDAPGATTPEWRQLVTDRTLYVYLSAGGSSRHQRAHDDNASKDRWRRDLSCARISPIRAGCCG